MLTKSQRKTLRLYGKRTLNMAPWQLGGAYDALRLKYGDSAATTFTVLRRYNLGLGFALRVARLHTVYGPGTRMCIELRRIRSEVDLTRLLASENGRGQLSLAI